MIPSKLNIHVKSRTIHMDIFIFLFTLQPYSKIYIQYGYHKDNRGGNSSMGKEKPDRYIQDGILIAIDAD